MLAAKEDRPDVMRALLSYKAHVDAFSRQELRISFPDVQNDPQLAGMVKQH